MSDHWQAAGNCAPADARLFDAVGKADQRDGARARIALAQAICRGCPVLDRCFRDAAANRDSGVRGGAYFERGQPLSRPPKPGPTSKIDRLRDAAA